MSDVMLHGVLCMPPELWQDTPIDVAQRHSRYLQASALIKEQEEIINGLLDDNHALRQELDAAMKEE